MKLLFPKNIYTSMLSQVLPDDLRKDLSFREASVLSSELENGKADVALVPSCDLLKHPHFLVSSKTAISFDGLLSNAFFYFMPEQNKFSDIYMQGDISTNEIILSKILFKEKYSTDVQIHLETGKIDTGAKNYLMVGDVNLDKGRFNSGLSLSDEVSEMLFMPYVNYVAVSKEASFLEELHHALKDADVLIEDNLDRLLNGFEIDESSKDVIKNNFNSVYYEMTNSEVEALKELLQLPYLHGITNDMVELKFV
ncbi:MAG: MqnA/MqnD/SBP family protein [Syntrophomonadaceae bacterium]